MLRLGHAPRSLRGGLLYTALVLIYRGQGVVNATAVAVSTSFTLVLIGHLSWLSLGFVCEPVQKLFNKCATGFSDASIVINRR